MTLFNKIKWIVGILMVFVIILTTNLIDKDNFNRLRNSVTTIYEDRIVASDLIFEMTILIQEKEIALALSDSLFFSTQNYKIDQKIKDLVSKYEQTKLTSEEQEIFNDLKSGLENLNKAENEYITRGLQDSDHVFKSIDVIVHKLYDLSKVQLKEGRREMLLSNKTVKNINIFTQIEVILLIIMAILVQVIILYEPKKD